MITKADIEKLAKLSRLKLTDAEKEKYAKDMENILAYVKQIDKISTAAGKDASGERVVEALRTSEPLASFPAVDAAESTRNVMREDDKPHESGIFTDELLKLAPRSESGRVKVKKIL